MSPFPLHTNVVMWCPCKTFLAASIVFPVTQTSSTSRMRNAPTGKSGAETFCGSGYKSTLFSSRNVMVSTFRSLPRWCATRAAGTIPPVPMPTTTSTSGKAACFNRRDNSVKSIAVFPPLDGDITDYYEHQHAWPGHQEGFPALHKRLTDQTQQGYGQRFCYQVAA